jgi:tetratricopeptide (TPR) repeat protein
MFNLVLAAAISAYPATTSGAPVVSIGNSFAESCYEAAEARLATSDTVATCNAAMASVVSEHDRVATFVNRGILRLIQGRYGAAEADFDAALRIQPRQAEAWLNKGISLYQRGQDQTALMHLGKAIELNTRRPAVAYYARAMANEQSGNVRAAYHDLTRAQSLAPTWSVPKTELARYHVRSR